MSGASSELSPQDYLQERCPRFWRWEEDAIVWNSGSTLTFHEELLSILHRLQPLGFPPFPALLAFISLTRCDDSAALRTLSSLERLSESTPEGSTSPFPAPGRSQRAQFRAVSERLQLLAQEPGFNAPLRAVLAEMVFEDAPGRLSPAASQQVLDLLRRGYRPPPRRSNAANTTFPGNRGTNPLDAFLWVDPATLTGDRLRLRASTGVDGLVSAPVEGEDPVSLRRLLDGLEEDSALGGLAKLACEFAAALCLPRKLEDSAHSPCGGFSDLATHGEPHRLLPTELAFDDLVLAARIAQGEALYLRRERPPAAPDFGRWILLDNGLRLWGVPRLRALAVALAVIAAAPPHTPCRIYAPLQEEIKPLTLSRRTGLIHALSLLNPHLSPEPYLEQVVALTGGRAGDAVLITHRATAPQSLRSLPLLARSPLNGFVITVDRSPLMESFRLGPHGRVLLQRVERALDLVYEAELSHPLLAGDSSTGAS